jgi:hypothetical protein
LVLTKLSGSVTMLPAAGRGQGGPLCAKAQDAPSAIPARAMKAQSHEGST